MDLEQINLEPLLEWARRFDVDDDSDEAQEAWRDALAQALA